MKEEVDGVDGIAVLKDVKKRRTAKTRAIPKREAA